MHRLRNFFKDYSEVDAFIDTNGLYPEIRKHLSHPNALEFVTRWIIHYLR